MSLRQARSEAPALALEVEEPQTEEISANGTPDAANDNDAAPANQQDITQPANDNPLPLDATTTE